MGIPTMIRKKKMFVCKHSQVFSHKWQCFNKKKAARHTAVLPDINILLSCIANERLSLPNMCAHVEFGTSMAVSKVCQ